MKKSDKIEQSSMVQDRGTDPHTYFTCWKALKPLLDHIGIS
jgi:hypothetical protein